MLDRECDHQIAMSQYQWSAEYHQPANRVSRKGSDGPFDFASIRQIHRSDLDTERWCYPLHGAELAECNGCCWIADNRHALQAGPQLFEELQPFSTYAIFEIGKTGGVSTGTRQAVNEACTDRIGNNRKHDRYSAGRLQHGSYAGAAVREDDVWRERGQLRSLLANAFGLDRKANIDLHIDANRPAQWLQALQKSRDAGLSLRVSRGRCHEHADASRLFGALRPRRDRPRRRSAAEQRDELPTSQVRHGLPEPARPAYAGLGWPERAAMSLGRA